MIDFYLNVMNQYTNAINFVKKVMKFYKNCYEFKADSKSAHHKYPSTTPKTFLIDIWNDIWLNPMQIAIKWRKNSSPYCVHEMRSCWPLGCCHLWLDNESSLGKGYMYLLFALIIEYELINIWLAQNPGGDMSILPLCCSRIIILKY